jgi:hypothetical protein
MLHFQRPILAHNFTVNEGPTTPDIRHPSRVCQTTHRQRSPTIIEGENPPNLTGQIKKTGESVPIYKEAEKAENVSGEIRFSLASKNYL